MNELKQILKSKKNIISLIILIMLIVAIPLGIYLVRTQKILKSRASNEVYNAFEVTDPAGSPLPYHDLENNTRSYDTDNLEVKIKISIKDLNDLLGN